MWEAVGALVPSIGVGLIFWFAIRAMLNADRRERQAMARYDRELERSAGASEPTPGEGDLGQDQHAPGPKTTGGPI